MRHDPVDPQLFVRNREKLRSLLKPNSIVIIRSNDIFPTNADGVLPHFQNADLYYLTGGGTGTDRAGADAGRGRRNRARNALRH